MPGRETDQVVAVAKHGAARLGAVVLEAEIPVAGRRAGEIGQFPLHPDQWQVSFQQLPGAAVELGDRKYLALVVVDGFAWGDCREVAGGWLLVAGRSSGILILHYVGCGVRIGVQ